MTATESSEARDVHAAAVVNGVLWYVDALETDTDVAVPKDMKIELIEVADQLANSVDPDEYEFEPECFGWSEQVRRGDDGDDGGGE